MNFNSEKMKELSKLGLGEADIIACLEEMKDVDHRFVSEEFIADFTTGKLSRFYSYAINPDNNVNILFRGNGKNPTITLYKNNHVFMEIQRTEAMGACTVSFDFNHARYTEDYINVYKWFANKMSFEEKDVIVLPKYVKSKKDKLTYFSGGEAESISWKFSKKPDDSLVDEIFKKIDSLFDDFFDVKKNHDYFLDAARKLNDGKPDSPQLTEDSDNAGRLVEKRWQQKFFKEFHKEANLRGGIYIYDMEYQQRMPHAEEVKEGYKKLHGMLPSQEEFDLLKSHSMQKILSGCLNNPDFMAVEYVGDVPTYLVFGEIKSTVAACTGPSGIDKHLQNMKNYNDMNLLIEYRKKDAHAIMENYKGIGHISSNVVIPSFEKIKLKNILILTDSVYADKGQIHDNHDGAVNYYSDEIRRKELIEKCKEYGCDLWFVYGKLEDAIKVEKIYEQN